MNATLLGVHTAQSSARFALGGKYTSSRMAALMRQRQVAKYAYVLIFTTFQ